jgi:hypothetical protein
MNGGFTKGRDRQKKGMYLEYSTSLLYPKMTPCSPMYPSKVISGFNLHLPSSFARLSCRPVFLDDLVVLIEL